MSDEIYTAAEFVDFLDDFAEYSMTIPSGVDQVTYEIGLPKPELVLRVISGINIDTAKNEGNEIRVEIYNKPRSKVVSDEELEPDEDWEEQLRELMVSMAKDWRERVLDSGASA